MFSLKVKFGKGDLSPPLIYTQDYLLSLIQGLELIELRLQTSICSLHVIGKGTEK